MKSKILLFGLLLMVFFVGGVYAGENGCNQDSDCACGTDMTTKECAIGLKENINISLQCPDFCSGFAGNLQIKCQNGTCIQFNPNSCAKEGEAYYPGTEKCCEGLKSVFPYELPDGSCISPENDTRAGAPVCAPCGNGKCESQYGEDKCNCAEDCNMNCTNNENNQSCCKNGTCINLFDDGLPSSCSNGNLPEFSGCDADCKPIKECIANSNGTSYNGTLPIDVLCVPDKKQCADGSYVQRAGPDCEFVPCPDEEAGFFMRIINWFKNIFG